MAKTDAIATKQDKTETALAVVPAGMEGMITIDRPEGHDEGTLGTEGMTRDDISMPRIGLAQKMSPEIDKTSSKYIEGLSFMDLYHSQTHENFGTGPLYFAILKRERPRWVEFKPIEQGGGIKDKDVKANDPRADFGPNGEKPAATMFRDYVVLLLNSFDPADPLKSVVALSLKSSGLKAAKYLNFLTTLRGDKLICKGVYKLTSSHETDKKTQGVYAVYKFDNAGWLAPDSIVEKTAIELFESWKDRELEVEREDPDSFDPVVLEREATAPEM